MKWNKKILSVLLSAVMVLSFAPTAILAGAKTPKAKTVTVRAVEDTSRAMLTMRNGLLPILTITSRRAGTSFGTISHG